MKRILLFSALAALPFVWNPAEAQQTVQVCVHGSGSNCVPVSSTNPLPVDATVTGSNPAAGATGSAVPADGSYNALNVGGTLRGQTGSNPTGTTYSAHTDITSIAGTTASAGAGAVGTGSQRIAVGQDTSTVAGSAPGTAGTPSANVVSIQGVSGGTSVPTSAADGQYVNIGTSTDAASCSSGTSLLACQRQLHSDITGSIPAGTNAIGTLTGSTAYGLQSAASTNATNVKASAGVIKAMNLINTTTTIYYLRMYNLATSPTCSSATGFVRTWPVPPAGAAGGAGGIAINLGAGGTTFSTGIAFCLTGGPTSTDNTNAATGVFVNLDYQ